MVLAYRRDVRDVTIGTPVIGVVDDILAFCA